MPNTLRLTQLRDKKEQEIDRVYHSISNTESMRTLYQATLARTRKNYTQWLTDNNIDGNKYK